MRYDSDSNFDLNSDLCLGRSTGVAPPHLARGHRLGHVARASQPQLLNAAGTVAHQPRLFTVTGKAVGLRDAGAVLALRREFGGVGERRRQRRGNGEHALAHGHQVDGPVQAPETPAPAARSGAGRTVAGKGLQDLQHTVQPRPGKAVDRIALHRDGQLLIRQHQAARDKALEGPGMARPLPALVAAQHQAQAVAHGHGAVGHQRVAAQHLAPAGHAKQAAPGTGQQLSVESGHVGRGADKAARRGDGVRRHVARHHHALAQQQTARMALHQTAARRRGDVAKSVLQPGGGDDFALHPVRVGLPSSGFDHHAEQGVAQIAVLEAGVDIDRRRLAQLGQHLVSIQERAPVLELSAVRAVARGAGAVRQQLGQGGGGQFRVQALHMLTDRIVQPQTALLAQLEHAGRGEGLGVRADAKAVARGQAGAARQVGVAQCQRQHGLLPVVDGQRDPGARGGAHLHVHPAGDVVDRRLQPFFHARFLVPVHQGDVSRLTGRPESHWRFSL